MSDADTMGFDPGEAEYLERAEQRLQVALHRQYDPRLVLDDGDVQLYHGDASIVLDLDIAPGSVQTVITSPPYWGLRNYNEDGQIGLEDSPAAYVDALVAVFRSVWRVLKDDGTVWVNLGDSYSGGGRGGNDGGSLEGPSPNGGAAYPRPATGLKDKDLVGVPWRVAFALQADGWYLRSDIVWSKPNPMPESVTDRPTKAHEYVFLLSKQPRYFYDADAIREANSSPEQAEHNAKYAKTYSAYDDVTRLAGRQPGNVNHKGIHARGGATVGRNRRSVWEIATQPTPEAHFATFPEALVRPCILAGSSEAGECVGCGKAWGRVVEREPAPEPNPYNGKHGSGDDRTSAAARIDANKRARREQGFPHDQSLPAPRAIGWRAQCECGAGTRPQTVLDPFMGSGTTAFVARKHGRRAIGIDLSSAYLDIAVRRLSQQSLFADAVLGQDTQ